MFYVVVFQNNESNMSILQKVSTLEKNYTNRNINYKIY